MPVPVKSRRGNEGFTTSLAKFCSLRSRSTKLSCLSPNHPGVSIRQMMKQKPQKAMYGPALADRDKAQHLRRPSHRSLIRYFRNFFLTPSSKPSPLGCFMHLTFWRCLLCTSKMLGTERPKESHFLTSRISQWSEKARKQNYRLKCSVNHTVLNTETKSVTCSGLQLCTQDLNPDILTPEPTHT